MKKKPRRYFGPWSWTKEDIRLLKRLYPKGKIKKVAERLGRPLTAVRQKAYDLGLKTKKYKYWSDDELRILKKQFAETPTAELAQILERSVGTVKVKAKELGLKKSESYINDIKSQPKRHRK